MSDYAALSDIRKEQIKRNVQAARERLKAMTPLEGAFYGARKAIGEDLDPYTPEEREQALKIQTMMERLEQAAEALEARILRRLEREALSSEAGKAKLAAALSAKGHRLNLTY